MKKKKSIQNLFICHFTENNFLFNSTTTHVWTTTIQVPPLLVPISSVEE